MADFEAMISTTDRIIYLPPSESRDRAVQSLFADPLTMLPYLAHLHHLNDADWAARRALHRKQFNERQSSFWDMVDRHTGEVVGTSGFRSICSKSGKAEWGIVVRSDYRRRGLCNEAFDVAVEYLKEHWGDGSIQELVATTGIILRTS